MLPEKYKRVMERVILDELSLREAGKARERQLRHHSRPTHYQNEGGRSGKPLSLAVEGITDPQIDKVLLDDLATNIVHGALTDDKIDSERFKVAIEWLKVSGKFTAKAEKEDRIEDYSELMKQLKDKGVFVPQTVKTLQTSSNTACVKNKTPNTSYSTTV